MICEECINNEVCKYRQDFEATEQEVAKKMAVTLKKLGKHLDILVVCTHFTDEEPMILFEEPEHYV